MKSGGSNEAFSIQELCPSQLSLHQSFWGVSSGWNVTPRVFLVSLVWFGRHHLAWVHPVVSAYILPPQLSFLRSQVVSGKKWFCPDDRSTIFSGIETFHLVQERALMRTQRTPLGKGDSRVCSHLGWNFWYKMHAYFHCEIAGLNTDYLYTH